MDSPDQFSDRGNAAKARRQNLPTLLTETAPQSDNQNYSRLPLSPVTALIHTRYKAVQCTPITAVPVKSSVGTFKGPMIRSPSTPLRTTILERFLADTYEADEAAFQQPLTLSTAGITDALPSPEYVVPSWGNVMGSPPETYSDCFSPVLGTGPAEQDFYQTPQSTTSYKSSEGDPRSALSLKSIKSSKSLPARLPNLGLNLDLNLHVDAEGAESAEGQIQQHHNGAVQKESNTGAPAAVPMPCSPTSTESTFVEEDLAATRAATTIPAAITVPPAIAVPVAKTTRFRRNSFPQLLRKRKDHLQLLATLPTPDQKGHPHPLRSAPFEAPVFGSDQEEQMNIMSPPPAPTTNNFEDQLPPVRIRIEPSPFSPPPAPTLGFFPVSLPEPVATIDSSPFDPPPAPTLPRFHEEFPSSPAHAGPAPIDTTIPFLPWRQTRGPESTLYSPVLPDVRMRSIDPPPAPTLPRFHEAFPASPVHTGPAPIDTTIPYLPWRRTQGPESTLNSPVLPDVRMRYIDPPPAPIQSSFPETFPASPVRTRPAPILTIPARETIVQMTPPAPAAESFDARHPNDNESTHPSVPETRATKSSKVVRFAVVESPLRNNHFKILPSPYPWPPRTIGDAAIASILTPTAVEFSTSRPYPKTEHCKPSMADVLLDGTTPRGRTEQRLEKVGRLTRSMSPKNSRAEESVEPAILPNTVFECQRDQSHSTRSPIASDKNIILRTYFNPNKAAIQT